MLELTANLNLKSSIMCTLIGPVTIIIFKYLTIKINDYETYYLMANTFNNRYLDDIGIRNDWNSLS